MHSNNPFIQVSTGTAAEILEKQITYSMNNKYPLSNCYRQKHLLSSRMESCLIFTRPVQIHKTFCTYYARTLPHCTTQQLTSRRAKLQLEHTEYISMTTTLLRSLCRCRRKHRVIINPVVKIKPSHLASRTLTAANRLYICLCCVVGGIGSDCFPVIVRRCNCIVTDTEQIVHRTCHILQEVMEMIQQQLDAFLI